jgi:hypothetical protein
MKNITPSDVMIIIVICFILAATGIFAKGNDTSSCLQISGKILKIRTSTSNSYTVALICGNDVVDAKVIKGNNVFKFNLKKNGLYTVRILKDGYVPRTVCVDTKLAEEHVGFYKFHFDTELIEEKEAATLNQEALEFPIALISYDVKKHWFNYNAAYTREVKKNIYASHAKVTN